MANLKELLVIGGTGFIGRHLVDQAASHGYQPTILSLHKVQKREKISGVEYIVGDLCSQKELKNNLIGRDIEYLVNLGGYIDHSKYDKGGRETMMTHFLGVQNLIQYLDWNNLKRFIQIGSSDEYGGQSAPQDESMREEPISFYSMGKVAAGQMLQMLYKTEGFPCVILRPFLVYGPGQDEQRFLPQIISGCLREESFPASYGEQLRDFCYIDDIINGIFRALESSDAVGQIINLASGQPVTIKNMIKRVQKMAGSGDPQFGKVPYRPGENMALYADITKAKKLLEWEAKVDLDEGIRRTIEYYKNVLI